MLEKLKVLLPEKVRGLLNCVKTIFMIFCVLPIMGSFAGFGACDESQAGTK